MIDPLLTSAGEGHAIRWIKGLLRAAGPHDPSA
jgi:hypothetical protein